MNLGQLISGLPSLNDEGANGNSLTWPLPERLVYAIEGLEKLRRERPDIFIGKQRMDLQVLTQSDEFPIDSRWANTVREYVIGRCLLKTNDVTAEGGIAGMHLGLARDDIK